ncbi:AMP-binding protein, partial [bacterium]|nr:AMP-binding protein [bacterium]
YLNNPEATREVIDPDGWFHTGDQGVFDEEGYLKITGRIKDLIVTSYGKNISAAAIESRISASPFISQVVVVGDRKKYITALVVPDWTAVRHWARGAGIGYDNILSLAEDDSAIDLIRTEIAEATKGSASYEKPKDFRIISEEFTVENGQLTLTLKLRRNVITETYKDLIDSMYSKKETSNVE